MRKESENQCIIYLIFSFLKKDWIAGIARIKTSFYGKKEAVRKKTEKSNRILRSLVSIHPILPYPTLSPIKGLYGTRVWYGKYAKITVGVLSQCDHTKQCAQCKRMLKYIKEQYSTRVRCEK